jgi:photosystem II stability/assembly factor-like uncharacterized protein
MILHTEDGGDTWTPQTSGTRHTLAEVYFTDEKRGWVVGDFGTILHTTDGGKTWTLQKSHVEHELTGLSFVHPNAGWIIGKWGIVLKYAG